MNNDPIVQLKNKSWVIPGPTNIGLVETADGAYLIDSGNDKESGRKLLKIIKEKEWALKGIINTHSNADHIGGNNYLQGQTGCGIWAAAGEAPFINMPLLEGSLLWGGYPFKELRMKFFRAKESSVTRIIKEDEVSGPFTFVPLPGHFLGMTGIITGDNVFYLGDSLFGEHVLDKYKIPYIYDVRAFRSSIEKIKTIKAEYYVPSHGEIQKDIENIADANLRKAEDIEIRLLNMLDGIVFEDILQRVCDEYKISLDYAQYALTGNTIRSFLSYLYDDGKAKYFFVDNKMIWERTA